MTDEMKVRALAKINLSLDILGRREDGYHEVRMVMQSVDLYDLVTLKKEEEPGIRLSASYKYLPTDEHNIAFKAAKLLFDAYRLPGGISIDLNKRIPVSAGLAGGSTDAAAVLFGMNRLYGLGLTKEELMTFGLKLGADVPFCLLRGTALAEGIGERLTPLTPVRRTPVVLVKPPFSVSTRDVYEAYDGQTDVCHPDTDALIDGLARHDLSTLSENMGNVLESVTVQKYPILSEIKSGFIKFGALNAMMSGSGPTVFGIFESENKAKYARDMLRNAYPRAAVILTHMGRNWEGGLWTD